MRPLRGGPIAVLVALSVAMLAVPSSRPAGGAVPGEARRAGARLRAACRGRAQRGGFDPRALLDRRRGTLRRPARPHEFYFTRAIYSSGWGWNRWAIDYPKADQQFMTIVNRLIEIDASEYENAIRLDDPDLRKYPFL